MEDDWTDKRMDDFADRVGRFEANVDRRFDKVDSRIDRFEGDVDRRFDRLEAKVDMTNRTIWASIFVAMAPV